MKQLLALLPAAVILAVLLNLGAGTAAEPGERTLTLKDAWTNVVYEWDSRTAELTVTNYNTSAHSVRVRLVSRDYTAVLKSEQTVAAGHRVVFRGIPVGGYVLQARSADGQCREYTLSCEAG